MAEYRIQGSTLDAIADAINTKTGGSSAMTPAQMVTEIAAIPSGTTITLGVKINSFNSSDRSPNDVDIYCDGEIPYSAFAYYQKWGIGNSNGVCNFHGKPTIVNAYAFRNLKRMDSLDVSEITSICAYAFASCEWKSTTSIVEFSKCTSVRGTAQFYEVKGLEKVSFPKLTSYPANFFGNLAALTYAQFGSVGHGVTSFSNSALKTQTKPELEVTIYTDGTRVDTVLANARNGATNATIIIKASEATTYNGTSYAAGDTILTSEVT